MRRSVGVLLATLVTGPAVLGQTPQSPVFRGGVTLVTVDVTVLDRDGKPVPGLTADDFEMKLDGHVQPVRAVAYEETASRQAPAASNAAPLRETTNATPPPEPRLFVILVDDLMIPGTRDKGLFFAASQFVADLPPTDVVGFTTSSGTSTVNPTRDRGAVVAGLRRAAGEFVDPRDLPPDKTVGLDEALEINAGDQALLLQVVGRDCFGGATAKPKDLDSPCAEDVGQKVRHIAALTLNTADSQMSAYLGVINAMRAAPGQKFLVLLTDGLLVTDRGRNGAIGLEPIAHAAAAAGVQLNVLFADPDAVSVTTRTNVDAQVQRADGGRLMQGIQTVADMTGGNFWRVMGQPNRFFTFLTEATSGVYHLGVEAPAGSPPGRDFTLAAHVKRSGLTVHANRVAVLPAPAVAVPVDQQLQAAVAKGVPNYGVPLAVATVVRRGETAAAVEVGANMEVPASAPGPLTVVFGLVNSAGQMRTGRKTLAAPADGTAYRLSLSLPVSPGTYRLRFGVADATGQVGSVDTLVTAQLGHVGPLLTSDVLTSWSDAAGQPQFLALEEIPARAASLRAFLELYAAPEAPLPAAVQVRWSLVGSTVEPVAEQSVEAVRAADRLTASGQFPLDSLAPGLYEIRATVLVDGRALGSVSTTVHKAVGGRVIAGSTRAAEAGRHAPRR
jgi:VWFA-related protein